MRRRPFLRTSALATVGCLAGYTILRSNHDPRANDRTVKNETDSPVFAGETVLKDLAEYGTYDLTVAVDGMPARSREWHATDCNRLTVRVRTDGVSFSENQC
ncbi:hypothetical protein [Halomicrococcus sp. NG-SE-24]|uniref:hypothetical protein n=1 Tax=Halomicrococcus sp. NG-SE-24 TaxID=3436928 RepID=UPI003D992B72